MIRRMVSYAIVGGVSMMAGPIVLLDTIQGTSYLAIVSQMDAVARHKLDLANYDIHLFAIDQSILVLFAEQGSPLGRGQTIGLWHGSSRELTAPEVRTVLDSIDRARVIDRIAGRSFQAIQRAMAVFEKQNPDLTVYKIQVARDNDLLVLFSDKDRVPGTRGYTPARPGFEVALHPESLAVLRANFVR